MIIIARTACIYLEEGAEVSHRDPASSADGGATPMAEDCLRRSWPTSRVAWGNMDVECCCCGWGRRHLGVTICWIAGGSGVVPGHVSRRHAASLRESLRSP